MGEPGGGMETLGEAINAGHFGIISEKPDIMSKSQLKKELF